MHRDQRTKKNWPRVSNLFHHTLLLIVREIFPLSVMPSTYSDSLELYVFIVSEPLLIKLISSFSMLECARAELV